MRTQTYLRGLLTALLLGVASSALPAPVDDQGLLNAAERQDKAAIPSLLQKGANASAAQPDGTTALHWAAHWGDLQTADVLIRSGAKPDAKNDYGATPLSLACEIGNAAMVEKLLAAGANPDITGPSGETPIMLCARTGSVQAVKSLVVHKANVNARDEEEQQTALMWAVSQKHADVAKALIDGGADIRAKSRTGYSPMMFAARVGDAPSADVLLAVGTDINEAGPNGMTPLVMAAASGWEKFAIHLLDKGADPNSKDRNGATAMHYALLKGITALNGTSYANYVSYLFRPTMTDLLKALLTRKADPNIELISSPQLTGTTPVGASRAGQAAAGATPYMLAAATPDVSAMRLLIASGANPKVETKGKLNPVMAAAGLGRHQDYNDDEKPFALDAVKYAFEQGGDASTANEDGQTALMGAASNGVDTVVQFLVDKGAKLDARDKYQQSPLSIATGRCLPWIPYGDELCEIIRPSTRDLLIKLGATPLEAPGYFKVPTDYSDAFRINQALRGESVPPQPPTSGSAPAQPK